MGQHPTGKQRVGGGMRHHGASEVLSTSVLIWQSARMPSYRGYRFPADIISHAVCLYHRISLSFRDVEELLAEREIAGPRYVF